MLNKERDEKIIKLYVEEKSICDIFRETQIPISTVRRVLARYNKLRSRNEGIRLAKEKGKFYHKTPRPKRIVSQETRQKLKARCQERKQYAKGLSLKPSGYLEFTMGEHKFKRQHVVIMEQILGRKLEKGEVVHHIDGCRSNNELSNLELMTRAEHARLHAIKNLNNRTRSSNGQFE